MLNKLLNLIGLGVDPEVASARKHMEEDRKHLARRMVWGIIGISYFEDPGYLKTHAQTALREWYEIPDEATLVGRIREYLEGSPGAYDIFRAACLARYGFGAGMIDEARSWSLALQAVHAMQSRFRSWEEFAEDYIVGHEGYERSSGVSAADIQQHTAGTRKNIAELKKDTWTLPITTQV